jgi:hypothetical protein
MAVARATTPWYVNPRGKAHRRFWTPARLFELLGLMEQGLTDRQIARHFGKSVDAITLARKRYRLPSRRSLFLSAQDVAQMMGIGCAKTVVRWIDLGFLKAKKVRYSGPAGYIWSIRRSALEEFICDPRTRHVWDCSRITDPDLKALANEQPEVRYLTPSEVADRFYVSTPAVNNWIWAGILPAVRYGNWMIPEGALEGFVPPGQRSRVGRRNWYTEEEDQFILRERASGKNWREIGDMIGRSPSSAWTRWHRLQRDRRGALQEVTP